MPVSAAMIASVSSRNRGSISSSVVAERSAVDRYTAAYLADRYISDRFLPDKAIDVIDEAGSRVKLMRPVINPELDELEKRIEKTARAKEEAVRHQEFEKAAELRDEQKKLTEYLKRKRKEWEKKGSFPVVSEEDIAYVVSNWTGIPLAKLV